MFDSSFSRFPDPFSDAHVARLRKTYVRVLPLTVVWAASFLLVDWIHADWRAIASGVVTTGLFLAWVALQWRPRRTLLILRTTLFGAFVGFAARLFMGYYNLAGGGRAEDLRLGAALYSLAILIIAAHTMHSPAGARIAALALWIVASLIAIGGLLLNLKAGTGGAHLGLETLRFVLAGVITIGLMEVFVELSGLQIRSTVQNSLLQQYALTDSLTTLPNRRAFQTACEREFAPACRDGRPMSLIVVDIDRFKAVNDAQGHEAGDRVLQQVAQVVRSVIRASDYPVRWGGDEFAILLPDSNLSHARLVAEKIRLAIESFPFDVGTVTVSLGAAQFAEDKSVLSLFRRADQALYEAKRQGRNRIEADHSAPTSAASVENLRLALDHEPQGAGANPTSSTLPSAPQPPER